MRTAVRASIRPGSLRPTVFHVQRDEATLVAEESAPQTRPTLWRRSGCQAMSVVEEVPGGCGTGVTSPVATSTMRVVDASSSVPLLTAMRVPLGDHAGVSAPSVKVSWRSPVPSTLMTNTRRRPSASRTKATWVPSGETAGSSPLSVSCVKPPVVSS